MKVEKCDVRAMRVYGKMKDFQCEPSKKSYITVFDILVEEKQLKLAFRFGKVTDAKVLFEEMKMRDCSPSVVTYSSLMHGLWLYGKIISGSCDINKFQEAANFLAEMVVGRTLPNRLAWSPNEGAWNLYRLTYR
ncbi:hypothetical protein V6N12_070906 [Hibiscus sabdariffa]|uniref:Pentatricopeptide repeat-containing protein n=1 Tax=Hibiscus sabdariffa TaxID=183260 RepID=A0ABR2FI72_9ROSI